MLHVPRHLAVLLVLAPLVAAGCGDGDAPVEPPRPDVDPNAPPSEALAGDGRDAANWIDTPRASWPQLVAEHDADLRAFGALDGGLGFLGVDEQGELLAVTARHYASLEAGLTGDLGIAYIEQLVKRWELVGPTGRARLTRRARSGCDAPAAEILLMAAQITEGDGPSTPLVLSERVPQIDEPLLVPLRLPLEGDPSRVRSATVASYADGAAIEFELVVPPEPSALLGAPVLDARGLAVACVTEIVGPVRRPDGPDATRVRAQVLRPFLRAPKPLRGTPVAFDNRGFERFDLEPREGLLFMGNPMLGGARLVRWPTAAPFEGPGLPEGQGAGAFTDEGWLVTAGRSGRFAVFDTLTRTTLVQGTCSLSLVTELVLLGDDLALLGSPFEDRVALVDLTRGVEVEVLELGGAALAVSPDGSKVALGSGEGGVYLVEVSRETAGTRFGQRTALTAHDDQVTSLAFSPDGALVASGGWDGFVRVSNATDGSLAWETAGRSEVNALLFDDALRLFVATGSIEDVGDERMPIDCYIRLFRGIDGEELLRSHDHVAPVVALSFEMAERRAGVGPTMDVPDPSAVHVLGVAIGAEHFRWSVPR